MPMVGIQKFHLVFFVFVSFLVTCRTRKSISGSEIKETSAFANARANQLDVNDVSFLFPPPATAFLSPREKSIAPKKLGLYSGLLMDLNRSMTVESELSSIVRQQRRGAYKVRRLEQNDFWMPLSMQRASGEAFLPSDLFEKIMLRMKGEKEAGFAKTGINFRLKARNNNVSQNYSSLAIEADASEYARWHMTSFRFDPCPNELLIKRSRKLLTESLTSELLSDCKPEVRVVAQPFIGFNQDEQLLGHLMPFLANRSINFSDFKDLPQNGFYVADYAMHLFYELSLEDGKKIAADLLELKKTYASRCSTEGLSLGVHPCLLKDLEDASEKFPGGFQDSPKLPDFANSLQSIVLRSANNLKRLAFMGSDQNEGPWLFAGGEFSRTEDGIVSYLPVRSAGTKIPQTSGASKSSRVSLFKLGMLVQLNRGAGLVERDESGDFVENIAREAKVIIPEGKPGQDSFEPFLLQPSLKERSMGSLFYEEIVAFENQYNELYYKGKIRLSNVESSSNYMEDAIKVADRIANPEINHEFQVDCASCHAANSVVRRLKKSVAPIASITGSEFSVKNEEETKALYNSGAQSLGKRFWSNQAFKNESMSANPVSANIFEPNIGLTDQRARYVLNQFSIYKYWPIVSERIVNESAKAAHNSNLLIGITPKRIYQCELHKMKVCADLLRYEEKMSPNAIPGVSTTTDWLFIQRSNQLCLKSIGCD
jgi:hypothetical protein